MLLDPSKESHVFNSLIILFIFILYPAVSSADADRIFRENNKAVVVIVTYDSQGNAIGLGSGFLVRADGAVATNDHVISNEKDNWTSPGFYFSKRDSRWIVPKRNPVLGWTFNLATKKGAWAMLLSFLIPIIMLVGIFTFIAIKVGHH